MTRYQRAQQLWSILVLAATFRHVYLYAEIAKAIGAPTAALGGWLDPVQRLCRARGLPPLTALVVSEADGLPGPGYEGSGSVPADQMGVFKYDWLALQAPTAEEFEAATVQAGPP
jgi:hypothetical protein